MFVFAWGFFMGTREGFFINMINAARQEFEQNFNSMAKQFGELQNMQALLDIRGEALEETLAELAEKLEARDFAGHEGKLGDWFKARLEERYKAKSEEFKEEVQKVAELKAKKAGEAMKKQSLIIPVTPGVDPTSQVPEKPE